MDEQSGILQAIAENPDDVTHRLVYADWLEDHEQGLLARFIRAQCALRPFVIDPEAGARYPVAIEVMSLQPELRSRLVAPFWPAGEQLQGPGAPRSEIMAMLERRFSFWIHCGFVEDVEVHGGKAAAAFVHHSKAIFARTPLLRLSVTPFASRQAALKPWGGELDPAPLHTMRTLLNKGEIARLRSLDLRGLGLGNPLGRCVLRNRHPLQPQRLVLDGNQIEEEVADRLRERYGKALVLSPYDPADDDIPF